MGVVGNVDSSPRFCSCVLKPANQVTENGPQSARFLVTKNLKESCVFHKAVVWSQTGDKMTFMIA